MDPVTVWWAVPQDVRQWHLGLLDSVEWDRRDRYMRDADRDRFTLGVVMTRLAAGAVLGMPPDKVRVTRTCTDCGAPHGRPVIAGGPHVSVSHSGERIAVAISRYGPLGVDVEATRRLRPEIAGHLLSEAEIAAAAEVQAAAEADADAESDAKADAKADPKADRKADPKADPKAGVDVEAGVEAEAATDAAGAAAAGLFAYWVRKEAILKATGDGLRFPMTGLHVSPPEEPPRLLGWAGRPDLIDRITLRTLDAGPGYAACLALLDQPAAPVREIQATELLAAPDPAGSPAPGPGGAA